MTQVVLYGLSLELYIGKVLQVSVKLCQLFELGMSQRFGNCRNLLWRDHSDIGTVEGFEMKLPLN